MTNKPMLSVERELLELVTDNRYINKESISIRRWEALCKLRSILSKQSEQHQGEPVPFAWAYEWASWISTEGPKDFRACIEREAPPQWAIESGQARNVVKLYAEQPAPAAVVIDIESAAKKIAERMDYPWECMPEQGRNSMRENAKAIVDAAILNGVKP